MLKQKWKVEYQDAENSWIPDGDNNYITETAGFIPLEVKFKQFEQNGYMARFNSNEFTSSDYRDMYLNPDFQISPEDDMEEAMEKIKMQREYINQLSAKKKAVSPEPEKVNAGTQEQKAEKVDEKTALCAVFSGSIDFVFAFFSTLEDKGQNNTHDNRQIERQESPYKGRYRNQRGIVVHVGEISHVAALGRAHSTRHGHKRRDHVHERLTGNDC